MAVVHYEYHHATLIAPSCSRASCFNLLFWVVCLLAPFFLGYYSNGLWLEELSARVVPQVEFKHQVMLMVEGSTAGSDLHWSTEPALNQLYGTRLRATDVSVRFLFARTNLIVPVAGYYMRSRPALVVHALFVRSLIWW